MGKITDKSNEDLLQHYANCVKTYYGSHGHGKAQWNEVLIGHYEAEIEARGLPVPETKESLEVGKFNGPGAV